MNSLEPGRTGSLKTPVQMGPLLMVTTESQSYACEGLTLMSCLGKSSQRTSSMKPIIYWIKGPWKGKLAIVARPRGNEWLEDEIKGLVDHRIDVIVSLLTNEE
jgi:hypothetical protein